MRITSFFPALRCWFWRRSLLSFDKTRDRIRASGYAGIRATSPLRWERRIRLVRRLILNRGRQAGLVIS